MMKKALSHLLLLACCYASPLLTSSHAFAEAQYQLIRSDGSKGEYGESVLYNTLLTLRAMEEGVGITESHPLMIPLLTREQLRAQARRLIEKNERDCINDTIHEGEIEERVVENAIRAGEVDLVRLMIGQGLKLDELQLELPSNNPRAYAALRVYDEARSEQQQEQLTREREPACLYIWDTGGERLGKPRRLVLSRDFYLCGSNAIIMRRSPQRRFLVLTDIYPEPDGERAGQRAIIDLVTTTITPLTHSTLPYYGEGEEIDYAINAEKYLEEPIGALGAQSFHIADKLVNYQGKLLTPSSGDISEPLLWQQENPHAPRSYVDTREVSMQPDGLYLVRDLATGHSFRTQLVDESSYPHSTVDPISRASLHWDAEEAQQPMLWLPWGALQPQPISVGHAAAGQHYHSRQVQLMDGHLYLASNTAATHHDMSSQSTTTLHWRESAGAGAEASIDAGVDAGAGTKAGAATAQTALGEEEKDTLTFCTSLESGAVALIRLHEDQQGKSLQTDVLILQRGALLRRYHLTSPCDTAHRITDDINRLRPQRVGRYLCLVKRVDKQDREVEYLFLDTSKPDASGDKTLIVDGFCSFYAEILQGMLIGLRESR